MAIFLLASAAFANAGLVEINSSNFLRASGAPVAQSTEITLSNSGELRISNVNLLDGSVELAAGTMVELNGNLVMSPFHLPPGGAAVYPIEAGAYVLTVTVVGKVGGGVTVSFYEDKPEVPQPGVGFEALGDGTVLQRSTGLIWEQAPSLRTTLDQGRIYCADRGMRVPEVSELLGIIDFSQLLPALELGHPFSIQNVDGAYWTATPWTWGPGLFWYVYLSDGYTGWSRPDTNLFTVWCVK